MSVITCDEAKGDLVALEAAIHNGLEAELTVSQIKEALSQLYAYTGFPRSLNALGVLQRVIGDRQAKGVKVLMGEDASPLGDDYDALKEGTRVQTQLVGKAFEYEFAEATDYYLKVSNTGMEPPRTRGCSIWQFILKSNRAPRTNGSNPSPTRNTTN